MYQIQIRVLAFEDIQQAVDYYEEVASHITDKFLEHLYLEINVIQENPELFQKKYLNTRVRYIKGFPFGIHYILRKQTIIVLAVLHTNRNPNISKAR